MDWRFAARSFFEGSKFSFSFPFKGARLESSKVRLSASILQQKYNTIIESDFNVKSKTMKRDLVCRNIIESNVLAVLSLLFIIIQFLTIL